jgi:uncharacterized protein (TIGR02231 family)
MKKTVLFLIMLLVMATSFSQNIDTLRETPDINKVTVFIVGAEISSTKSITLKTGRNVVIFKDLSTKLNSQSIRVSTADDASILNVSYKTIQPSFQEKDAKYYVIKDSITLINAEIATLTNKKIAFETEKNLLTQNMNLGGTDNGVDITELKEAADFYRVRILEISNGTTEIQTQMLLKNEKIRELNQKLTSLSTNNRPTGEITVLVDCDKAKKVVFDIQYQISDAGWSPAYDIRASDLSKPIQLYYRANVYNNTGIEWKDVNLVLSTSDPSISMTKPILSPWYLNFDVYTSTNNGTYDFSAGEGYMQNAYVEKTMEEYSLDYEQNFNIEYTEVEITSLNAEFELDVPYSIPSDNLPYLVDITDYELPAKYEHYAVTKVQKEVFILAKITGWEELNLVEGTASIFYDGTYVGQSYIYTRNVKDTLDLSLGIDEKVLVTRTKVKEFSNKQFIGNKVSETFAYELVAKNNRTTAIDVEILDQIPISQTDEIEVEIVDISKATYDEATGEAKWKLHLEPGSSEKKKISYTIKYPKNKTLKVEQTKKQKMRLF